MAELPDEDGYSDPEPAANEELWTTLERNGRRVGYRVTRGHMVVNGPGASAAEDEAGASSPEEGGS